MTTAFVLAGGGSIGAVQVGMLRELLAPMTDAEGMLDEDKLKRFVGDAPSPVFYLAGPPAMVEAMKAILERSGVAADDVRSEEFFGY